MSFEKFSYKVIIFNKTQLNFNLLPVNFKVALQAINFRKNVIENKTICVNTYLK